MCILAHMARKYPTPWRVVKNHYAIKVRGTDGSLQITIQKLVTTFLDWLNSLNKCGFTGIPYDWNDTATTG